MRDSWPDLLDLELRKAYVVAALTSKGTERLTHCLRVTVSSCEGEKSQLDDVTIPTEALRQGFWLTQRLSQDGLLYADPLPFDAGVNA